MNLDNKQVTIQSMSVQTYPPVTTVKVAVTEETLPDVFKVVASFDIRFEQIFTVIDDANLLALINEKLRLISD
jgi:hypothetical protein